MVKYFATAGIRHLQASNGLDQLGKFPFIVLIGPSGQFAQVEPPSGQIGADPGNTFDFQAYEHAYDHRAISFFKNELIIPLRQEITTGGKDYSYAWQPEPQLNAAKINDATFETGDGTDMSTRIMFDGTNWKHALHKLGGGTRESPSFLRIPGGGIFWVLPKVTNYNSLIYGVYTGEDPEPFTDGGGQDGWQPRDHVFGSINKTDPNYRISHDGTGDGGHLAGIEHNVNTARSDVICDLLYHEGTVYIAGQHYMAGLNIAGKGNWIFHDNSADSEIDNITISSSYTLRAQQNVFGGHISRSLTVHNGTVYMLSGNGKVYRVTTGGLKFAFDLTNIGSPWGSGIISGDNPKIPAAGAWAGANANRCLLTSYRNKLHAFLNFQTSFNIAKGVGGNTGKGVMHATSIDGVNWTDSSQLLPTSGIISASGIGIELTNWLTRIAPYKFSAFTGPAGVPLPDNSGVTTIYKTQGIGSPGTTAFPTQPSGFRQIGTIPFWSSGTFIDPEGTSFNNLGTPLLIGALSGQVFPTLINYPLAFIDSAPVVIPSGQGPTGYDYTGCDNYHISGYTDKDTDSIKLLLTRDFQGGEAIFMEFSDSFGWIRHNYVPDSKQLNGLEPIMLYDPEVVIASGSFNTPNPKIDTINNTVTIDYTVLDWPFWSNVNVIGEFSLDGQTWKTIKTQNGISTGTKASDPSGVIGNTGTFVWNYTEDGNVVDRLSKNLFYKFIQVRLRAEEA